jgi:hypothetical protein
MRARLALVLNGSSEGFAQAATAAVKGLHRLQQQQ